MLCCLPNDDSLFRDGPNYFRVLADNHLYNESICGYHDVIDDIILGHEALRQSVEQVMSDVSTARVPLYEHIITSAVDETIEKWKLRPNKTLIKGNKIMRAETISKILLERLSKRRDTRKLLCKRRRKNYRIGRDTMSITSKKRLQRKK